MSSENLNTQVEQQQFPAAILQPFPEKKPRKKRQRSIIKHRRSVNADIARAKSDGNRKIYERVFLLYAELRGTCPIGACNLDPTCRRNGISFSGIEFLADVDLAVAKTLRSHEREKFYQLIAIELQDLSDESRREAFAAIGVNPVLTWRLCQRLGRAFFVRGLDPVTYFQSIRRKKCDEQPHVRTLAVPVQPNEDAVSAAQIQQSTDLDANDFTSGYGFGVIESASYE